MKPDTIAAIATALSNSGIGIIRVSGPDAVEIVDKIYVDKNHKRVLKSRKSHTIHYGFIIDENEEIVDEVMVSYMQAPNSFTAEDTVEINCHGGILVINRILQLVLKSGARLADPGEFSKRAFLNGRLDLSEAEAIMDLISSENEIAMKSSIRQLKGSVSKKIKKLRQDILYEIAFIESALDDPEHISLEGYPENLALKTQNLIEEIQSLLSGAVNGKILKEGIKTVIVGKPNVGKSSLLNRLAGENRAIVTDIAGTTRDILEESIKLGEISLRVIDTAGIHTTKDTVEKIGVEKAISYAKEADLIVYVIDSSVPFDENDDQILSLIKDKKVIILLNKSDIQSCISIEDIKNKVPKNTVFIKTSTKENTGLEDFENAVKTMFLKGDISQKDQVLITSMRHMEALSEALSGLYQVQKSISDHMPEDFYSIDLMNAYSCLGRITGEEVGEDLINEIFSKFCMGK